MRVSKMDEYEKWLTINIDFNRWWIESSTNETIKANCEQRVLEFEVALKKYRTFKADNADTLLVHIAKI